MSSVDMGEAMKNTDLVIHVNMRNITRLRLWLFVRMVELATVVGGFGGVTIEDEIDIDAIDIPEGTDGRQK